MEKLSQPARDAIMRVLKERFEAHGFRGATMEPGFDHDGDPILHVTVHFDLVSRPLDPIIVSGMARALRDALDPVGETRFPMIIYDFHEDQEIMTPRRRKRA